jgi:matrixin
MVERRMNVLISTLVVLFASAALWKAFVRPAPRLAARATRGAAPGERLERDPIDAARNRAPAAAPATPAPSDVQPPPPVDTGGPSYIVLLARSEMRRRIRGSARITYLDAIVAASSDSALHRWDGRGRRPVRVWLPAGAVTNFQPGFLDAVRAAFQRWEAAGVAVRFDPDADSASAEVRFQWRTQFAGERSGLTSVQWDQDGHILTGVVTLATMDPKGQPLAADDMRVIALHEIGHLIGLDHSPDADDLMYPEPKVRDLSSRDVSTALLLYDLPPGSLRAGR